MESGIFSQPRRFRPENLLSDTRLLSLGLLPWKLNKGHPEPSRVLSGQGIAEPVSLHESHAIGSVVGKSSGRVAGIDQKIAPVRQAGNWICDGGWKNPFTGTLNAW
jgi:hypothetical protein